VFRLLAAEEIGNKTEAVFAEGMVGSCPGIPALMLQEKRNVGPRIPLQQYAPMAAHKSSALAAAPVSRPAYLAFVLQLERHTTRLPQRTAITTLGSSSRLILQQERAYLLIK
jgi:hypothetical protein